MSLSLYILPSVATDLTSQAKMVSGFFVFVTTFCIGFTQREKKYVKVIDDDISGRRIEFKANMKW